MQGADTWSARKRRHGSQRRSSAPSTSARTGQHTLLRREGPPSAQSLTAVTSMTGRSGARLLPSVSSLSLRKESLQIYHYARFYTERLLWQQLSIGAINGAYRERTQPHLAARPSGLPCFRSRRQTCRTNSSLGQRGPGPGMKVNRAPSTLPTNVPPLDGRATG